MFRTWRTFYSQWKPGQLANTWMNQISPTTVGEVWKWGTSIRFCSGQSAHPWGWKGAVIPCKFWCHPWAASPGKTLSQHGHLILAEWLIWWHPVLNLWNTDFLQHLEIPQLPAKRRQWPDHLRNRLMQCFSTGSPRCPLNKRTTQRASLLLLAYLLLTSPASDKKAPVCGAFPLMQEDAFDTAPALLLENQNRHW